MNGPKLAWAEIASMVEAAQAADPNLRIVSVQTTCADAPGALRLPFSVASVSRGDTNLYQSADGRDFIL